MATITTGVYRHLKDRSKPLPDKLKLVRLVWRSKRIFLQNKEQVLIDFLSGLIFNKKRLKLSEDDVSSVWSTLSELLQYKKTAKSSRNTIIIKPSICQVINDSISQLSSFHHHVVQCCLNLLLSPSLCHVYIKFDLLATLLSNLLQLIAKSACLDDVEESHWTLLQTVIPRFQQVQRSHPNQKMVLQVVIDKLLVFIMVLWSDTRNSQWSSYGEELITVLHNTLFNKDHSSSYTLFLHSIVPDSGEKAQPPKHVENFFNVLSQCVTCKSLQSNLKPEKLRGVVLTYIPVYFKEFLDQNRITDSSVTKDLFVYLCKLMGLNLSTKDSENSNPDVSGQSGVLITVGCLLQSICEMDLYDKSHDPVYRQLTQILLTCDRSKGYFSCLKNLLKLNHLIIETRIETILQQICSNEVENAESLDSFLVSLIQLYSKLRQMEKFVVKLINVILNGNIHKEVLLTDQFCQRFGNEVEMLPQGTSVEVWQTLVDKMNEKFLDPLSIDSSDTQLTIKFDIFVHLLTVYMSNTKVVDYTITDINKRKVKDIMVTMASQLTTFINICNQAKNKKNADLACSVMTLLYTWGEMYLLMCQYTQHSQLVIDEGLDHPHWITAVYNILTPQMSEQLYKLSQTSGRLQYLWTLKSLWMTNCKRSKLVNQLIMPQHNSHSVTWNCKLSDITEQNLPIARWKLFTDNFALYGSDLTLTQLESCASIITESLHVESHSKVGTSMFDVTSNFLKTCTFQEHRDLMTALISYVWQKLDNSEQWKIPKKLAGGLVKSLSKVFLSLGDKAWLQKDQSFMEKLNLNEMVKKVLNTSVNKMDFTDQFPSHLKTILPNLPLPFLDQIDQTRCFIGLLVTCYHGNQEVKKSSIPLLTLLVESSTAVLKVLDLNLVMDAVLKVYVHQSDESAAQDISVLIATCLKSICKERTLMEKLEDFIDQLTGEIIGVESTIKKKQAVTKPQEAVLQITSILVQQLYSMMNRPYIRDDILSLCKQYVKTLSIPVFALLNVLRKVANQEPVLPPLTHMYALLLDQSENLDSEDKSQQIYDQMINWSLEQLKCNKTTERLDAAIVFMKQSCKHKGHLELPFTRKTALLDNIYELLKHYHQSNLMQKNIDTMEVDEPSCTNDRMDKSTSDLNEELLSLASSVVVSCDISQFKDLLYNLEQSVNVDLSVADNIQVSVCLHIWNSLLSCDMSEEQGSHFLQSIYNLTGYLNGLARQVCDSGTDKIGKLVCDLQHKTLLTCPVTKQMILTTLGCTLLIPVTMETFPSIYKILNEVLLNHHNTVFSIIPVFLNCCKHLLFWLIEQGDQEMLSKTPDITSELIGCVHMIDRLFTLISTHKEEFSKVVVYVVADYVDHVHKCTLLPVVKKALVSAMYKLLDISDRHILAQLQTVLNQGVREVFKGLYSDYTNFYKYTGKV